MLGRTIQIERRPFVVVGVMPPAFRLPEAGVQLWIPWPLSADHPHDQHYLGAIARLSAGVSMEDAETRLARVAAATRLAGAGVRGGGDPARGGRVRSAAGSRPLRLPAVASLTEGTSRVTDGRRLRAHDGMVIAQVAMAVVLLIGSALLLQSVRRLTRVDSGFDPRGVLVLPVFLDSQAYRSGEHSRTYHRTLFDRLSVFAGPFDLERAERVCAGEGIDEVEVAGLLGVLVDKSMLVAESRGSRTAYRQLETLRAFGREQLEASPEATTVVWR